MAWSRAGFTFALLAATACAGGHRAGSPDDESRDGSSVSRIVIPVATLVSPVNVVSMIQSRVTNLQVRRHGPCPELEFRGRNSILAPTPPAVYINGQHAINTCILDLLDPHSVDRVEVYPQGVSNRPGYHTTAGGLILVFLKDGREETTANNDGV